MRLSRILTAVDAHAAGEPGRVVTGGVLDIPGRSMLEKRDWLQRHGDGLRRLLLREPRGYPAMCCNLILPSAHPDADAGFVIMEQTEYPAMSGSNTICVATVLLETGMVPAQEPVTELVLEAPAGLIRVRCDVANGKVTGVTFENVPAFAVHLDVWVDIPELGTVRADIAYGGMFYVLADAARLGVELIAENAREIARVGEMLRAAAAEQYPVRHPEAPTVIGPSISLLSGPPTVASAHRKNAVTVSTGRVDWSRLDAVGGVLDRSPCGTGTCAQMAVLHARGALPLGRDFVHEGILGTTFTGRLLRETKVGPYRAVVPTLTGRAWITGMSQYVVDADDPFPEGFTVGDIWGSARGS
jgi:proline racemase